MRLGPSKRDGSIPADELSLLLKVSAGLAGSLELEQVLQIAIDSTIEVLRVETGAIYLLKGNDLILGATRPALPPEFAEGLRRMPRDGHAHIEQCLGLRAPVFVPDVTAEKFTPTEQDVIKARNLRSILYVPIASDVETVGVMIVGTQSRVHSFVPHDAALCQTLSCQIALAVTNARLYGDLRRANEELAAHRDHLEELVDARTRELEAVSKRGKTNT
jgi:GAF domain-containing protein